MISYKELAGHFLWIKFFFQQMGASVLGRILAFFVGGTYLVFFYLTCIAAFIPQSMVVTTIGMVSETRDVGFIVSNRLGARSEQYCLVRLDDKDRYAFKSCPPCAYKKGAKVIIKHNPLNYFSRRMNTIKCVASTN